MGDKWLYNKRWHVDFGVHLPGCVIEGGLHAYRVAMHNKFHCTHAASPASLYTVEPLYRKKPPLGNNILAVIIIGVAYIEGLFCTQLFIWDLRAWPLYRS